MSKGDEWRTPDDLYDALNGEFHFEFDLCANKDNAKCALWSSDIELYYANTDTDLEPHRSYWMNPPYSRDKIRICMATARELNVEGHTVVCLVRFDPSANWFQLYVHNKATEVRMLNRRVKFIGAPSAYNFPCCVVVYEGKRLYRGGINTTYTLWGWK